MKKISIDDIDFDLNYEGYYWYSNDSKPKIVNKISKEAFTNLPFIIEGNFYCLESDISISIKHIDGAYQIYRAELNGLPIDQKTEEEYLAHDLDGIKKLKMIQYWEEGNPDELLAEMTTLIPSWQAFAGFVK